MFNFLLVKFVINNFLGRLFWECCKFIKVVRCRIIFIIVMELGIGIGVKIVIIGI